MTQLVKTSKNLTTISLITAVITLACNIPIWSIIQPDTTIIGQTEIPLSLQTATEQPSPNVFDQLQSTVISTPDKDTPTPNPSPTATHTPTPFPITVYVQAQSPVYVVNFLYPDLGCQWLGVAGQIFNSSGSPVNGLIIEANGRLEGHEVLQLGLSGLSRPIGPGGYEIPLFDRPIDSNGALTLRVLDQNGSQLNETLSLTTYNDCRKNLIIINFVLLDHPLVEKIYFPILLR